MYYDIKYSELTAHEKRIYQKGKLFGEQQRLLRTLLALMSCLDRNKAIDENALKVFLLDQANAIREIYFYGELEPAKIEEFRETIAVINFVPIEDQQDSINKQKEELAICKTERG